ncbi:hypothetical protein [Mycolicibacterium mengxianglii]|uniref:hypothetical protein n=1 Tax=Mycolicibacterium mengxianglii TaxID=2736649 RepID=UPI0018EF2FFE|nr:hypothetical protein [Mycolicibacterium mengxianglii]
MTTTQFRPGSSPLLRAATNARLAAMLADIDGFRTALAVADKAAELAQQIANNPATQSSRPATPEDVTTDWLDAEVDRRRYGKKTEESLDVLRNLEIEARSDAADLIQQNAAKLVRGLADQLKTVCTDAAAAVDALGPDVNDPAAAIQANVAGHWKTLTELRAEYDSIRRAQLALYRDTAEGDFDQLRCGNNQPNIPDPEARLFFHRNLPKVAPKWRGHTDSNRLDRPGEAPWPSNPVEQLVWFIRNDSGIWCPTSDQIKDHLARGNDGTRPAAPTSAAPAVPSKYDEHGQHRTVDQTGARFDTGKPDLWNMPVGSPKLFGKQRAEAEAAKQEA